MTQDDFTERFKNIYRQRDDELQQRFQRSLPINDAMVDRWERAQRLGFAEGVSIYGSSLVYGDVWAGAQTWIGPMTLLDGSGGALRIGSHCSISAGTYVYTHDTALWALSGGREGRRVGPVSIGNDVYLGSHCLVLPNVSIGDRVLVAANSMVNRDVAAGTIVAGTPARPIGRVELDAEGKVRLIYDRQAETGGLPVSIQFGANGAEESQQ